VRCVSLRIRLVPQNLLLLTFFSDSPEVLFFQLCVFSCFFSILQQVSSWRVLRLFSSGLSKLSPQAFPLFTVYPPFQEAGLLRGFFQQPNNQPPLCPNAPQTLTATKIKPNKTHEPPPKKQGHVYRPPHPTRPRPPPPNEAISLFLIRIIPMHRVPTFIASPASDFEYLFDGLILSDAPFLSFFFIGSFYTRRSPRSDCARRLKRPFSPPDDNAF